MSSFNSDKERTQGRLLIGNIVAILGVCAHLAISVLGHSMKNTRHTYLEIQALHLHFQDELKGGGHSSNSSWYVILVMHNIINYHGPQACISHLWPVNGCMDQDCSCLHHDHTNCSFSDPILMVSSNSAKFTAFQSSLNYSHKVCDTFLSKT